VAAAFAFCVRSECPVQRGTARAIPVWPATITTSGGNSICRVPHLARKFGLDVEVSLGTQRSQTLADVPETARRSLAVSGMAL
jgi:4'-phosphopantetheinyl transferase EntD